MSELAKILAVLLITYFAYVVLSGPLSMKGGAETASEEGVQEPAKAQTPPSPPQTSQSQGEKVTAHSQVQDVPLNTNVLSYPQLSNNYAEQGNFVPSVSVPQASMDCFPKDQLKPADLLPTEGGFLESNPAPVGSLSNRNFLESGYHAGLNTQSNTKRNGNRQLRSDPPIARQDIGPWNQSTYDADTNRKHFEIGSA